MKKDQFTAEQVVAAVEGTFGITKAIAGRLKCSRKTVENYARKYKVVRDAIADERSSLADMAEVELVKAVRKGQPWAIGKVLEAFGKGRGYEPEGQVSGKITVEIVRRKRDNVRDY